jgi:hypothetical protein
MTRWWKSQEEGLQSRRRALAEVSTAAPGDVELQDEVAGELGKVRAPRGCLACLPACQAA